MYILVNNKKIEVKENTKFIDKIKSIKFVFNPIDYCIKVKSKHYNTYMFCQTVDICVTDKSDNIIKLYENVRSEKIKFFFKGKYIYYLPLGTCKHLVNTKKITIKKK